VVRADEKDPQKETGYVVRKKNPKTGTYLIKKKEKNEHVIKAYIRLYP